MGDAAGKFLDDGDAGVKAANDSSAGEWRKAMAEISRILTAAGLVIASTALVIYGIGASFVEPRDYQLNIGIWGMIIGVVIAVIGIIMSKRIPEGD